MMVVSRLGRRTNNLYIQRQSFIWGYTITHIHIYNKYYQFTGISDICLATKETVEIKLNAPSLSNYNGNLIGL